MFKFFKRLVKPVRIILTVVLVVFVVAVWVNSGFHVALAYDAGMKKIVSGENLDPWERFLIGPEPWQDSRVEKLSLTLLFIRILPPLIILGCLLPWFLYAAVVTAEFTTYIFFKGGLFYWIGPAGSILAVLFAAIIVWRYFKNRRKNKEKFTPVQRTA